MTTQSGAREARTGSGRTWVWRPPALPGVELMVGTNASRRCRLIHEGYAFCAIPVEGNRNTDLTRWRYRGREHVYRPLTLGVEEPGEVHQCVHVYSPIHYWFAQVDAAILDSAADELGTGPVHFRSALVESLVIHDLFASFFRSIMTGATPLEQQSRLAASLRAVIVGYGERAPAVPRAALRHPGIERAHAYLREHFIEPISLQELARVAGLSRFHLTRVFTAAYGLSPHAYQNQLRIAHVRRALRSGRPLSDIESGFFDQSHLIRHFRDSLGVTPREYASPPPPQPVTSWTECYGN